MTRKTEGGRVWRVGQQPRRAKRITLPDMHHDLRISNPNSLPPPFLHEKEPGDKYKR